MNDDLNAYNIEHELQVRLLNFVIDEASDYERDQLMHLMEQRPELKLYAEHLRHLHGLLVTVGGGDWNKEPLPMADDSDWKLSHERRAKLLATLAEPAEATSTKRALLSSPIVSNKKVSQWLRVSVVAASVCFIAAILVLPAQQAAREAARRISPNKSVDMGGVDNSGGVSLYYLQDGVQYFPPRDSTEAEGADAIAYSLPSNSVTVPDGGTTLLGGIKRDGKGNVSRGGDVPSSESSSRTESLGRGLAEKAEQEFAQAGQFPRNAGSGYGGMGGGIGMGAASDQSGYGGRGVDGLGPGSGYGGGYGVDAGGMGAGMGGAGMGGIGMGGGMGGMGMGDYGSSVESSPVPHDYSRTNKGRIPETASNAPELPAISEELFSEFSASDSENIVTKNRQLQRDSVNQLFRNNALVDEASDLKMTVSPRIIIPKEEEEKIRSKMDQALAELEAKVRKDATFGAPDIGRFAPVDKFKISSDREIALGVDAKAKPIQPAKPAAPIRELSAATEPFSTFSLFVSDVSFQLAQAALNQGRWPERSTVRVEEFLNAFDYQDPTPNDSEMVACQIEQSTHPFLMQRNLVRIAMKTGASGRALNMPLRLTVLLDISGSMERYDRKQAVLRAFQALVDQLRDQDQITLIGFANTPRLIADRFSAEQARALPSLIANTPSQGGTNIEAALALAREKAHEQYTIGGQNRIVMLTDGAVNLGNAEPNSLSQKIVELRNEGIAFDAAGVCAHGLNDEVLEALTRQGDGRYYLINAEESTSEQFSKQLAGALRPTAKNVKVQVEFNPQRVGQYRLLGFEKHQLNKEDFRNDQVDAAELAAAEAGVAMYQVEVKPDGFGDIGTVSVRFQDVSTGRMVERLWPIPYSPRTPSIDAASPTMRLASVATLFAMKLRGEPSADRVELPALVGLITGLPTSLSNQPRVQALQTMLNQARTLGEPPQVGY